MDEQPQQNLILNDQLSNEGGAVDSLQGDVVKQPSPLIINGETHVSLRPSARPSYMSRKASKNRVKHIIYTIKDYALMFILLIVSIPNYSILSLFYLLCGLLYIFLIQTRTPLSKRIKLILEIILTVYALACLIFKAVICSKYKDLQTENELYVQLGVVYLLNQKFLIALITFISDIAVIVISVIALIISLMTKNVTHVVTLKGIPVTERKIMFLASWMIWVVYLATVGFGSFNVSICSLVAVICAHISLFIWSITKSTHVITVMKICHFFIIISSALVLVLNALYNINYPILTKIPEIIEQLGVMQLNNRNNFDLGDNVIHFCFCAFSAASIILASTAFKIVKLSNIQQPNALKNEKDMSKLKITLKQASNSFCMNLFRKIAQYFKSPYFILHFCRVSIIVWLYLYRMYISCLLLIWLFASFLVLKVQTLKYFNYVLLWPSLFYTCYVFHFANIKEMYHDSTNKSISVKYGLWGIKLFKYQYVEYPFIHLVIMLCFLYNKAMISNSEQLNEIKKDIVDKKDETLLLDDTNKEQKKEGDDVDNKKVPLLEKDESNDKENAPHKDKEIRLIDLIMKFCLIHIDKITLVCMYLIAMNMVNLTHFILVVIFMIQLVYPKAIETLCLYIIILIQLLFAAEYVFDISKVFLISTIQQNSSTMNIIKFIVTYDEDLNKTSVEILLLLGIYCFYIQRQNYHSQVYYQLIKETEHNTLTNYIEEQFIHLPTLKKILFFIGNVILELYVWILIILVFFFICYFEVNVLFTIKFVMFLIICYQFLSSLRGTSSNSFRLCFYWVFLIFCSLNTLLVYFYQFLMLPLFKNSFSNYAQSVFGETLFKNFPVIGLKDYNDENIWISFLPHFALNFISVLFYAETKRIIDKNRNPIDYTELTKHLLRNEETKHLKLINNKTMQSEEKKLRIREKYDDNKKTIHKSQLLQSVYEVIIFLSKFYWLIIFNMICILFTSAQLSLVLIIYIALFGITFILMYYKIIRSLSRFIQTPSFFLSKLIRKSLNEDVFHLKQTKHYRYVGFKMLFIFSIILFTGIYSYAVFDFALELNQSESTMNKTFNSNSYTLNIKCDIIEDCVKAASYLIGIYTTHSSIIKTNIIHFVLFLLISADAYVQKLQNYFTDKSLEKKQLVKKLSKHNALYKARYLHDNNILKEIGFNINQLGKQIALPFGNNNIIGSAPAQQEQQQGMQEGVIDDNNKFNDSIAELDALDNIKNKYKDDYLIEQFKYIFIKAGTHQEELSVNISNNKNKIIQGARKLFEELTILMLIIMALSKINIFSYFYMILVIYLYLTKKSMKKFYNILIILIVILIVQCLLFLSNLSEYTDPNPNKDILALIKNNFGLPWWSGEQGNNFLNKAFFLALGVNKLQVQFLILDFIVISIIYVYLDYFSYAIYQDSDEDMKKIVDEQLKRNKQQNEEGLFVDDNNNADGNNNNNNKQEHNSKLKFYSLTGKKKLLRCVQNLQPEEFNTHKVNLQYTFNIDIGEYSKFKETFLYHGRDKLKEIEEEDQSFEVAERNSLQYRLQMKRRNMNKFIKGEKKSKQSKLFKSIKSLFYMYLHNIVLTAIIIISMLISGLISAIYISFSLYFLMKSTNLILGNKCDYPKAIKTFMRIIIVVDILIQLIFQAPFVPSNNKILSTTLKTIGINTMINYTSTTDTSDPNKSITFDSNESVLVYAKAFICFIMSIQVVVYSSEDFQKFYLAYILTKKELTRKLAFMNVFWFNNKRIEQMSKEFEHRKNMKKAMTKLESMLEEWDQKLGSVSTRSQLITGDKPSTENDNKDKEKENDGDLLQPTTPEQQQDIPNEQQVSPDKQTSPNESPLNRKRRHLTSAKSLVDTPQYLEEEEVKKRIKEHILKKFLVKILLSLHKANPNYNSIEKSEREDFIKDIITGKTELLTIIEREINIELESLDLTEITEKDIPIITDIIDNASKLQKEEEARINKERKEREHKLEQHKAMILSGQDQNVIDNNKDDNVDNNKPLVMLDSLIHEKYLSSPKFIQVKRLVTSKTLFRKYLRTSYILGLIIEDIVYFIGSNSHYLCYVVMLFAHFQSTSILSIVYPIGIFCYGVYENPRPGKFFWTLNMRYTIAVIILKFVLNLHVFIQFQGFKDTMDELQNWKIGFGCYEDTFSNAYFKYIFFDTLLLFFLFLQEYILISRGLWNQTEKEIENIHQAYERIYTNQNKIIINVKKFNEKFLLDKSKESLFLSYTMTRKVTEPEQIDEDEHEEEIENVDNIDEAEEEELLNNNNNNINKSKTKYFDSLFPKIRNEKPGSTYYAVFTIVLMLIIIYLIFFYTKMDQDRTFGEISMQTTQFSGAMVLWVFVYVIFAVIDRVIYIRQSRNHLQFEYKYYHKDTGVLATADEVQEIEDSVYESNPELIEKKHFEIPLLQLEQIEQRYNIVIIQKEPTNYPLIMKYVLNIVITVVVHITAFFFLPMYGNMKLTGNVYCTKTEESDTNKDDKGNNNCNDFVENNWIIIFYLLNLLYIFISSLQIKHGYLDMIPKSLLKTGETSIHSGIHTGYKTIPFLYELKLAIDWTFTRTSLDIFQWNKFEGVYDLLYTTLCAKKSLNQKPVGMTISNMMKGYLGVPIFSGIILLLIGPLLLFSNLNPINELNNITGATIEMQISIKQGSVYKNYTLFKNDHVDSLDDMDDNKWNNYYYNTSTYTKNFPRDQVQVVRMSNTSDNNWDLAVPHINHIIRALSVCDVDPNDNTKIECNYNGEIDLINLKLYYEFTRPRPENNKDSIKDIDFFLFDKNNRNKTEKNSAKIVELAKSLNNCSGAPIVLENFYLPSVRLSSDPHPTVLRDESVFNPITIMLKFNCQKNDKNETEYYKSYFELYKNKTDEEINNTTTGNTTESIEFHTFSDKISEVTSGYSVITFYVTFVLLAGNYVRNFFTGAPEKIMLTELPDPRQLVNLCEGIKTSRYSFELEKEEQLYYVLIEFIRSPEYLRMITKSSVRMFKERKQNVKNPQEDKDNE